MHELGRSGDDLVRPDRPFSVIHVQLGHRIGEVDIGFPIGIERADIAPIFLDLLARTNGARREEMRDGFAMLDDIGDDIAAEIALAVGIVRIAAQLLEQELGGEDVDAHGGERDVRLARHGRRIGRLFQKAGDLALVVNMHDAEGGGLHAGNLETAHRHIRIFLHMLLQHELVIHLVDMIAGQHDDVFGRMAGDDVDVLEHRIGRAFIPVEFVDALGGRENVEALVPLGPHEVPGALHVPDERVRLVLRRHPNPPDAAVDGIGQREIDDAGHAAEIDRRLGAIVGEFHQPAATSAREDIRHGVTCERLSPTFPVHQRPHSFFSMAPRQRSAGQWSPCSMIVASGGNVRRAAPFSARTAPRFPIPLPP